MSRWSYLAFPRVRLHQGAGDGGWVVADGLGCGAVLALLVHSVGARLAAGVLAADATVWAGVLLLLMAVH